LEPVPRRARRSDGARLREAGSTRRRRLSDPIERHHRDERRRPTMTNATTSNRARVKYRDMREYLDLLEAEGLLHRITAEVDPHLEIGAVSALSLERKGPALLFENVKGYPGMPLVTNVISTIPQMGITFNTNADEESIHERVVEGMNDRIASVT